MHLTRYTMYRKIGQAIGGRLQGQILGVSGIKHFYQWIDRASSVLVEVEYPEVDMQELPFPDGRFDVVISDHVIAHLPDPRRAIREAFRVLKTGGLSIHTTCSWNPEFRCPEDYFRFSPAALRVMCPPGCEVLECGSWGNRLAMGLLLLWDSKFRFLQIPERRGLRRWLATWNEPRYPIHSWIVAKKAA